MEVLRFEFPRPARITLRITLRLSGRSWIPSPPRENVFCLWKGAFSYLYCLVVPPLNGVFFGVTSPLLRPYFIETVFSVMSPPPHFHQPPPLIKKSTVRFESGIGTTCDTNPCGLNSKHTTNFFFKHAFLFCRFHIMLWRTIVSPFSTLCINVFSIIVVICRKLCQFAVLKKHYRIERKYELQTWFYIKITRKTHPTSCHLLQLIVFKMRFFKSLLKDPFCGSRSPSCNFAQSLHHHINQDIWSGRYTTCIG